MAYRSDPDLEFLAKLPSEDLNDLVYCLTRDNDGDARLTEELTQHFRYKANYPDHQKYWDLIAAEIQCFGANTFATMWRGGRGVLYKEVLSDVCDKLKVNYNINSSAEKIEMQLLGKILGESLEKMSPVELELLAKELGMSNMDDGIKKEILIGSFQAIFRAGGFKSYQLSLIIVNAVVKAVLGRGLTFVANRTLTKTLSIFTGPVGWMITGAWAAIDIASPAFRVTIPTVVLVAALRQKYLYSDIIKQAE